MKKLVMLLCVGLLLAGVSSHCEVLSYIGIGILVFMVAAEVLYGILVRDSKNPPKEIDPDKCSRCGCKFTEENRNGGDGVCTKCHACAAAWKIPHL